MILHTKANVEEKTVGSATYNYYWNGSQLEAMTWSTGWFKFYYDASGAPYAVQNYDAILDVERTYLYVTNVQGDVVAVINAANGQTAVSYEYDAWGKLISKTSSSSDYASVYEYNPLTYRGYIYDNETGFYYLQTRYYDPTIGRFINEDRQLNGGLLGKNLYAYCINNPANWIDPSGEFIGLLIAIGVGLCVGFGLTAAADYFDDGEVFNGSVSPGWYVANSLVGGVIGGLIEIVAPLSFTFSIPGGALLTADGAAAVAATVTISGEIIAGTVVAATACEVSKQIVFSKRAGTYTPNVHGAPNSTIRTNDHIVRYDENGNMSYRVDFNGKHGEVKGPHVHRFKWYQYNGEWRYIKEKVIEYVKEIFIT